MWQWQMGLCNYFAVGDSTLLLSFLHDHTTHPYILSGQNSDLYGKCIEMA